MSLSLLLGAAEVPLRQGSINDLGSRYYEQPVGYHGTLVIAVPPNWIDLNCEISRSKPISPPENLLAFILRL